MPKDELFSLAQNPEFISGIYNYCDRWCERCPLSSRCLLYATEQADADLSDPAVHDLNNEKFWKKLHEVFESTNEMIREWAAEAGVDLESIAGVETAENQTDSVEEDELAKAAQDYAAAVQTWFEDELETAAGKSKRSATTSESDLEIEDATEIIRWYQFFIAVKVSRALSGLEQADAGEVDEDDLYFDFTAVEDEDEDDIDYDEILAKSSFIDSNGSAKIALLAIDRSIGAWRLLQVLLPEKSTGIKPVLLQLDQLRTNLEARLPHARGFIRPGFDENLSEFVS